MFVASFGTEMSLDLSRREKSYQSENDLLFNSQMSGDIEEESKVEPPSTGMD